MSKTKTLTCVACERPGLVTRADVFHVNDSGYIQCPNCSYFNSQPDYERFVND